MYGARIKQILFQNHPQRYEKLEIHINLTLQTTTKNSLETTNPARDNKFFVVVCSVRLV